MTVSTLGSFDVQAESAINAVKAETTSPTQSPVAIDGSLVF